MKFLIKWLTTNVFSWVNIRSEQQVCSGALKFVITKHRSDYYWEFLVAEHSVKNAENQKKNEC